MKSFIRICLATILSVDIYAASQTFPEPPLFINGLMLSGPIVTGDNPNYNEVIVDPNGILGKYKTIQLAINYVRNNATLAKPWTIRLLPGIYLTDVTIDATNLTGVRFVGAGPEISIVGATKTWIVNNATGGVGFHGVFDVSGCNDVTFFDMQVNGVYGDDGTILTTANAESGILHDNMQGNLVIRNCLIRGSAYAVSAGGNANASALVEIYNSTLLGNTTSIRGGAEKWHIFSSDLRGTTTNTNVVQINNPSGLSLLGTGEFQVWGCHIHGEDQRTVPSSGSVAGIQFGGANASVQIIGCTVHVMVPNDGTGNYASVVISGNNVSSGIFVGDDLIYETGTMTGGVIGAIQVSASTLSSNVLRFTSCNFRDNGGSGGNQRGWLVRNGSAVVNAGPTIDISGSRYLDGIKVPTTQVTLTGTPSTPVNGSTTLVAGTATVKLITDSGASSEVAASFTNASISVTGGTNYITAGFTVGMFVKKSTDTDASWTRIKTLTSTTLTLEEGYLGTTGVGTANKGTPNIQTQNDSTYKIIPSATSVLAAAESYYITPKKPGFFTITSSNAGSTATIDWILTR